MSFYVFYVSSMCLFSVPCVLCVLCDFFYVPCVFYVFSSMFYVFYDVVLCVLCSMCSMCLLYCEVVVAKNIIAVIHETNCEKQQISETKIWQNLVVLIVIECMIKGTIRRTEGILWVSILYIFFPWPSFSLNVQWVKRNTIFLSRMNYS